MSSQNFQNLSSAGFFIGHIEQDLEVDKAMLQHDPKKSNRNQIYRGKGYLNTIKIGWGEDNGQEVIVRHKPAPRRKERSAFSWFEEFTMAWSETFISKD